LVSPYEPKKKSAGPVRFLSGIASKRTVQEHEISELAKSEVSAPEAITPIKFKVPTAKDYKHIPKKYMWGKPLLIRAIPQIAFLSKSTKKCMLTFDDMWALMKHEMLDVQIVMTFAL
jgi:hypothetical protein